MRERGDRDQQLETARGNVVWKKSTRGLDYFFCGTRMEDEDNHKCGLEKKEEIPNKRTKLLSGNNEYALSRLSVFLRRGPFGANHSKSYAPDQLYKTSLYHQLLAA